MLIRQPALRAKQQRQLSTIHCAIPPLSCLSPSSPPDAVAMLRALSDAGEHRVHTGVALLFAGAPHPTHPTHGTTQPRVAFFSFFLVRSVLAAAAAAAVRVG